MRHWKEETATNASTQASRVRYPIASIAATTSDAAQKIATAHHSPTAFRSEIRTGKNSSNERRGSIPSSVKNAPIFG